VYQRRDLFPQEKLMHMLKNARCTPIDSVVRKPILSGCRDLRPLLLVAALALGPVLLQAQAPAPVVGFADLHNHQFSNLGFGGAVIWGEPFHPAGIQAALPHCDFAAFGMLDYKGNPFTINEVPTPLFGYGEHGAGGLSDNIGTAVKAAAKVSGAGHKVGGYPEFDGWPRWDNFDHQAVYVDWLYRAFQGGLKLMVVQTLNNEVFCQAANQRPGFGCDDFMAVQRQVEGVKALVNYIDQQWGGPGKGWYQIAYTSDQARRIINSGKMAVVLGVEVDNPLNCRQGGTDCTVDNVGAKLQAYYDLGIRHMFPIHLMNNGFGGAAIYEDVFNVANAVETGSFYQAYDCSAAGYRFKLAPNPVPSFLQSIFPGSLPYPNYTGGGHCNSQGLTPVGKQLIKEMMARNMIIDIDHMSAAATNDTLAIVEAVGYPVVAGHTGFVDTNIDAKRSEGNKTGSVVSRVKALGGLVAPILMQGKVSEISQHATATSNVSDDCDSSTKTFAQAYLYAVDAMRDRPGGNAVALGSDFNGMINQGAPRFGSEGCANNSAQSSVQTRPVQYPFSQPIGSGTVLSKSVVGDKIFDINYDGVAHVGMLPDFVQDLKAVGVSNEDLAPLFNSAEAYIDLWAKAENHNNSAYAAQFISQNVPSTMQAGRTYQVSVTMQNIGTITWTPGGANPFRLGAQTNQNDTQWGPSRVELPGAVPPGGQVTFNFTVTAPTTPGTYNFDWRMLQEMVQWFGQYTTNVPVQVNRGTMSVSANPSSFPMDTPVQLVVTSKDAQTGQPVPGSVLVNNKVCGSTNTTITCTFKGIAKTINGQLVEVAPTVTVTSPTYNTATVALSLTPTF
jgi:microsomal dipeptidase-like Zn-dependent dipeptidase